MSALANIWTIITTVARIDDDTTRLTLTDIGLDIGGKFQITGVGSTEGDLYEGLQFTATRVTDDTVDIDWLEHGYTAPADDWTTSGMVRLYEAPTGCEGAMRINFGHNISSLTSTGNTGEFGKDNILNSNRESTHTFTSGDQQMVATMTDTSLVEMVGLIDLVCDLDATIRIRGAGTLENVDVSYPALSPRFRPSERPKLGYKRITPAGHNLEDLVPHGIFYAPPMMPATVTINILNSSDTVEFSELMICSYYTPQAAKNFNYGSSVNYNTVAEIVRRGAATYMDYDGRESDVNITLEFMDAFDRTYIDLITKSKRTAILDLYPDEFSQRWETMGVGFITGSTPLSSQATGGATEIHMTSTKLHPGL